MIPLRDVIPSRTTPWVNFLLIGVNVLVFFYELLIPADLPAFFATWGLVPAHFSWVTATTSMFLHAGWLHIGSNLLSLWIFGDNVEDRLGHGRYLIFYLLAGYAAGAAETWASSQSLVPLVGASGAIAGVMGAYLVKFPRSRIIVLVPIFIFFTTFEIPAPFVLLFWFATQFFSGIGSLATNDYTGGGVAWFAHIGGFLVGMLLIRLFPAKQRWRPWYEED
jgi:membrane associated rhomboid family serine protease